MNRFDYNIFICSFKFISKPDEWFVEGTEVKLINPYTWPPLNITKINNGTGLFQGRTTSTHSEITEERTDTESCQFDEFYIMINAEMKYLN